MQVADIERFEDLLHIFALEMEQSSGLCPTRGKTGELDVLRDSNANYGDDKQRAIANYGMHTLAFSGLFYLSSDSLCNRDSKIFRKERGIGPQTSDG